MQHHNWPTHWMTVRSPPITSTLSPEPPRKLDGVKRDEFIERANALAHIATAGTVDEFARRLDLETKRLQDDDGIDRLERQRRNARARSWVDVEGMWNLSAKFDPVTGVQLAARIDATVQAHLR